MYFFPPRYVRGSVYDTYLKKMQVKEGKKNFIFLFVLSESDTRQYFNLPFLFTSTAFTDNGSDMQVYVS